MRKDLLHSVLALMMLGIFSLPILVPAIHNLLEEHTHTSCTAENSFHYHDNKNDCSICDYLIGIKTFHVEEQEEQPPTPMPAIGAFGPESALSLQFEASTSVRGPPRLA